MNMRDPELPEWASLPALGAATVPSTGTIDDDDEPDDEHAGENEAPIREISDAVEAPEEFEVDHEDDLGHPEDDDADDDELDEPGDTDGDDDAEGLDEPE